MGQKMSKTEIVAAVAIFFLFLGLSMAQEPGKKTAFEPLTSTYEGIDMSITILSEVKFENNHYVLSWTLSNTGKEKIKLFPKNMNMLICLLPLENKDFSTNLNPGETKTVTMDTISPPMALNTIESLGLWDEELQGYDDSAFITFRIYALSLETVGITLQP
jgi:hypothetical protein